MKTSLLQLTPLFSRSAALWLLLFFGFNGTVQGQQGCNNFTTNVPPFCQCTDCGDLDPVWETVGTSTICEGEPFQLTGASSTGAIEDYHWYFIDIASNTIIDQFVYTTPQIPPYTYQLQSMNPPDCDETSVFISVVLITTSVTCAEGESCRRALKDLEILLEPRAFFEPLQQQCVDRTVNFRNLSCYANNYLWDFGDGSPTSTDEDPSHIYQNPGTYTVTLTASNDNCAGASTTTQNIVIVGLPEADYSYTADPGTQCVPTVIDFTSQSNQWSFTSWCINPVDTLAWCLTDTAASLSDDDISVRFKQCGKYEVIFKAINICDEVTKEDSVEIFCTPFVSICQPPTGCDMVTLDCDDFCINSGGYITNFHWEFTNGSISFFNGECFGSVTFTESGTATLIGESPCGDRMQTVNVVVGSTVPITFDPNNPSELCIKDTMVQFNSTPIGIWSPSSVISSSGIVNPGNLSPGNYEVTVSAGTAECPNMNTTSFTVLEEFIAEITEPAGVCDQATIQLFDLNLNDSGVDTYNWFFENGSIPSFNGLNFPTVTFNQSGSIILMATGECGTTSDTVQISVTPNTGVQFGNNPDTLCSTSSPIQLEAMPVGTWSSSSLSSALSSDGMLDPTGVSPGVYQITFTPDGDCVEPATINIRIIPSANVTVQDEVICIDSEPITLSANPSGGTWDGMGITDINAGTFDPNGLAPDTYDINYAFLDANGCSVARAAQITVEALPLIDLLDTTQLCLSDMDVDLTDILNYSVSPSDGNTLWSGPSITDVAQGTFNSNSGGLGIGFHEVFVEFTRNDCVVRDSAIVELIVNEPLSISPDTTICIDELTFQLESNLSGGTWSGPGADDQGLVTLSDAGGGTHVYTYRFATNSSCEQIGTTTLTIIDLSAIINPGPDEETCEGGSTFALTGASPIDGVWTGTGVNATTGVIDLTQLQLDTIYTYTYCIESTTVADCEACASRTFIIHSNPIASFDLEGLPCINEEFQLINTSTIASDDVPLSYIWDFGDGTPISTATSPFHIYTSQGTYTITLIVSSTEGCRDTIMQDFYITTKPIAAFDIVGPPEGCAPFLVQVNNMSSGDSITQSWCVAGDTILGPTLDDIYLDSITMDSIFTILLKVENLCGVVTDEEEVLVHPYPIVDFGISSDEGCSPLEIDFSNTTLGNADNFQWIISNGNTYTDSIPPNQIFTTSDTLIEIYTVTLIATNECGSDTLTKDITVFPPDVRSFIELDTLSGCEPFLVAPLCFATPGAIVNWLVYDEAGNVQGSDLKNPEFILATPGTHMIVLIATNPDCGSDNDTAYVEVLPAPEVSFEHLPWVCIGDTLFFTNTSVDVSGTFWEFGDDSTSTDYSPFHIYDTAGTFTVTLTASSAMNDCPASFSSEVLVRPNPTAAFSPSDLNGCRPLSVNFTNQSMNANTYKWDFGDNTSISFDDNPTHVFENAGTYTVTLTASDDFGCSSDSTIFNIIVYDLPESKFSFEDKPYCHRYDSLQLVNESIDAVAYEWVFQGDTFDIENPVILPQESGVHNIVLTVWNNDGCPHTLVKQIEVLVSPIADAEAVNPLACEQLGIVFENNSSFSDGYLWDFGNGNTSTDVTPGQVYTDSGTYLVVLTSTNINGCPDDRDSLEIVIWPNPLADFDFEKDEECGTPALVTFTNNSIGNPDNDWDFGDGNSLENVIHPIHTYEDAGDYQVRLIVENQFGCLDTLDKTIGVFGQPEASYMLSDSIGCEDFRVQLINTSTEGISFQWLVDSFPPFTDPSPSILFENPGVYGVQLIAIYNDLCQDTTPYRPNAITVYESPFADFDYEADGNENIIGDVQFINLSQQADRFSWDLGDGSGSEAESPFHEYDINRGIDVLLTAYNDNGGAYTCVDDTLKSIEPEWITTFFAPNVLSPDSGEDPVRVFRPVGIGLRTYKISIYSAWGDLVWYSEELIDGRPSREWDGTQNGKALPQGTYVWLADIEFVSGEGKIFKGTVTIIR